MAYDLAPENAALKCKFSVENSATNLGMVLMEKSIVA